MGKQAGEPGDSWTRRTLITPVMRLLRHGASPERLAWSIAVGAIVGINPLFGTATVVMVLLAWLFRLNQTASQVGVHTVYPLQLLLFLPFVHAGTLAFGTEEMLLTRSEIIALARAHPVALVRLLWTWEWHALIIWFGVAAVVTPPLAVILCRLLRRALNEPRCNTA